jgi:hypothetical protein
LGARVKAEKEGESRACRVSQTELFGLAKMGNRGIGTAKTPRRQEEKKGGLIARKLFTHRVKVFGSFC